MFKKSSSFIIKIGMFLTVLFMLGCASSAHQTSSSDYIVETDQSKHIRLDHFFITNSKNGIIVKGHMHNIHGTDRKPKGHIDVEIVGSKNEILHKTLTSLTISPFGQLNRHYKKYRFKLEVPYVPAKGSTILLTYHPAETELNKNH